MALLFLSQCIEIDKTLDNLLFCIITYRASIYNDTISILRLFNQFKPIHLHNGRHNLAISHIHLTSIGFNIKFFFFHLH